MRNIVWIGPMDEEPYSKKAAEIRERLIKPQCEEHNFGFYYPKLIRAENWYIKLLQHINRASGLICDLSGDRRNVYFEYGYAYALNIPILLICRTGTDMPTDLMNIQWHFYDYFSDIESIVIEWLDDVSSDIFEDITNFTETLPHSFQVLEGDGHIEYVYRPQVHKKPFHFDEIDTPLTLETIRTNDSGLGDFLLEINRLQIIVAKKTGRPFTNGDLLGYDSLVPKREHSGTQFGATIRYRSTNYFTFVATHYPYQAIEDAQHLEIIDDEKASKLRQRLLELKDNLTWPFANPLTATLFLLVEYENEKKIIVQHRDTSMNFHARFPLQATAAGVIHQRRVLDQNGDQAFYDPIIAHVHELLEEFGVLVNRDDVKVLGFVKENVHDEVGFVGFVRVTKEQVASRKIPVDVFESEKYQSLAFIPSQITEYIKNEANGGKDFVPLALAGLTLIMIHEFGEKKTKEIFSNAKR